MGGGCKNKGKRKERMSNCGRRALRISDCGLKIESV